MSFQIQLKKHDSGIKHQTLDTSNSRQESKKKAHFQSVNQFPQEFNYTIYPADTLFLVKTNSPL